MSLSILSVSALVLPVHSVSSGHLPSSQAETDTSSLALCVEDPGFKSLPFWGPVELPRPFLAPPT